MISRTEESLWHETNDAYLSSAVLWLRLKLELMSRSDEGPEERAHLEEEAGQAYEAMNEAERCQKQLAMVNLVTTLKLTCFEKEILLLCAAMEMDTRLPYLCALAQSDARCPYPTFALAMALFEDPAWEVLSPERPLRFWHLIEVNRQGLQPLIASPLRIDERALNYLKGLNHMDERLSPFLTYAGSLDPWSSESISDLLETQQQAAQKIVRHIRQATSSSPFSPLPVIQLLGADQSSKHLVALHASAALGLYLCTLQTESLPSDATELDTLIRLWQREYLLLPVALYIDTGGGMLPGSSEVQAIPIRRFASRTGGVLFMDVKDIWNIPGRESMSLEIAKPTAHEQRDFWSLVLGKRADGIPALLSGQFNLNASSIQRISRDVQEEMGLSETDSEHDPEQASRLYNRLWDECLSFTRPGLDKLALRIDAKSTWQDIVLPKAEKRLLMQIADQVRLRSTVYDDWGFRKKMNRGFGISALFSGESGTGKTMAAEVIANELRLSLYRIDLSAVVSKYIGETEKNLARLFDAAEDGGAILLFDEADALFGKRSEVKDSHDRYANIEINYLLQRIESYRGLAILATNMKSALDKAFLRRLRFIVNFSFPDAALRKTMWEMAFPEKTPASSLDFEKLANFSLTGGSIHSIALNSAFMAASQGGPVTMQMILEAIRAEYRKMDKPVSEAEFQLKGQ